ncbi:MAG: hypothetical protein AAGK78_09130 [Planctomycetota bacterium]
MSQTHPSQNKPSRGVRAGSSVVKRAAGALAVAAALTATTLPREASADVERARRALQVASAKIERELLSDPALVQARDEAMQARTRWLSARDRLMEPLATHSGYLQLREAQNTLQEELDGIYDTYRHGIPPRDQVAALTREILEIRQEMAGIESDVMSRDAAANEARKDFIAAARVYVSMRRSLPGRITSDPRYRNLHRAYQRQLGRL